MIEFKEVTKQFPAGNVVLEKVSFSIKPGEFVVITGPSGSGKTTIAKLLIKEIEPTSGEIFVDSENLGHLKVKHLPSLRKKVSVIFQDYKIIPDKTVAENISLALQIINFPKPQILERITHLLGLVGLSEKENLFPGQLSGGELQRAAIARAVAVEPSILFADEPTGNLDLSTASEIMLLLKKINQSGTTVIVSTHDPNFIDLASRHLHLLKGKIVTEDAQSSEKSLKKAKKAKM